MDIFDKGSAYYKKSIKVFENLKVGLKLKESCELEGISYSYLNSKLKEGENDFNNAIDSKKADFYILYLKAKNEMELECLKNIREASAKNRVASAWILERTIKERYSQQFNQKVQEEQISISSDIPNDEN